jgi:hypothetical protein
MAATDEDGTRRCCARPLAPSIAVRELPPAAFRTTFAG